MFIIIILVLNKLQLNCMNILYITSSPVSSSHSTALGNHALEKLKAKYPTANITTLALEDKPLPYLSASLLGNIGDAESTNDKLLADSLIEQLLQANVVIIAAPMHNFGIPSNLKSWIDLVARAGSTFRYTSAGPEGLVHAKAITIVASGGIYRNAPHMDHATPYLHTALSFLGMSVHSVKLEGTAMQDGLESRIEQAKGEITAMIQSLEV
jgi:FMN-dependent NADH-azoreductase